MPLPFLFRDDSQFDVVGFGFNSHDHVCVVRRPAPCDVKQRLAGYTQLPGGQVPTALVALQRWGMRTAYVGPLGADEGGRMQRVSLEREGVNLSGCRTRTDVGSHVSVILVDQVTGERTIHWHRPGGLGLCADELDRTVLTAGRVLLMDADDLGLAIVAAGWAKAAGVMVVLDVDDPGERTAELLALTDVVAVADQFPQRLTGLRDLRAALRRMCAMGPVLAAVTLGAGGALAYAGERFYHVRAFSVPVVDTTAAGDLFHAGCIYGLLHGWPVPAVLRFAAAAGALACERLGGRTGVPSLDRVVALAAG